MVMAWEAHTMGVDLGYAGQGTVRIVVHGLTRGIDVGLIRSTDAHSTVQQPSICKALPQLDQNDILSVHTEMAALKQGMFVFQNIVGAFQGALRPCATLTCRRTGGQGNATEYSHYVL